MLALLVKLILLGTVLYCRCLTVVKRLLLAISHNELVCLETLQWGLVRLLGQVRRLEVVAAAH